MRSRLGFYTKIIQACGEKQSHSQTGEMRRSLIPIFALVLQFIDKAVLGELATVHGDVKLTASKNCPDRDDFELTTAENFPKPLARRVDGLWRAAPGGPFIDRVKHHAPSSLTLTDLNFKDSGHVVFVCNGEDFNTVELKVLAPHMTTVTEGETAVLFCYSLTAQVSWSKEGGEIRDQEVFSKEDEASPGRFLLILEKVRQEDQGVYFCNASMASKLIVNPRKPNQTTSPPPPHPNTTQSPNEGNEIMEMRPREMIGWVLVAVLVVAAIVLAIFLYLEKKKGRKPNESPERSVDPEQTGMELLGQTRRNGSHV